MQTKKPDPIGLAAADLGYPQSLNLYTYVNNNPANYTDPSGLFCPEGGCDSQSDHYKNENDHSDWLVNDLFGGGGGGGRGGQLSAMSTLFQTQQNNQQGNQTDCERFANMTQQIANQATDEEDFFNRMARTFTAANDSTIVEMTRNTWPTFL